MKRILLILALLPISFLMKAQTISLGTDNEYCPNIEYEFTVTLPGPYYSISATQMLITQQPTAFNSTNTSFKFKAKFNDVNIKQFVEIRYNSNGSSTFKPEYKRVKSLFYSNNFSTCGQIQPKFVSNNLPATSFEAPLCQVTSFNITFAKIKWYTHFESTSYCFGTISDYEYLLPAGWKLGTSTSNGSTYLQGTNTVTITSDLSTGNGSTILIRPKNTCGTNLANGQIPVQIVVVRSAANLTMSASPSSIPCGSTSPVTFTINNTSSLSGITGYIWNLGSTNGWLYNGIPAPSAINTATNSITLTPVCGAGLTAPSADITVSNAGNNCNINIPATSLSVDAPSLSIQGVQTICSGTENYSLIGLPCTATNIWSVEPANGIVTINPTTGQNTSLTRVADGNITLTAKVTACGTEYPVSIPIHVGAYSSSDYNITGNGGPVYWCPGQTYAFAITGGGGGSNYQWTYPSGWTPNYISGYLCVLNAPTTTSPPTGSVTGTFTEPCGNTITKSAFIVYSSSQCTSGSPKFTFAPNPTTSYLNVQVAPPYSWPSTAIKQIYIVNVNTGTTMFNQSYGGSGVSSAYITTSGFPVGTYSLQIFDGGNWYNYQFMKQ